MIQFYCVSCGTPGQAPDNVKRIQCGKCGAKFEAPEQPQIDPERTFLAMPTPQVPEAPQAAPPQAHDPAPAGGDGVLIPKSWPTWVYWPLGIAALGTIAAPGRNWEISFIGAFLVWWVLFYGVRSAIRYFKNPT